MVLFRFFVAKHCGGITALPSRRRYVTPAAVFHCTELGRGHVGNFVECANSADRGTRHLGRDSWIRCSCAVRDCLVTGNSREDTELSNELEFQG